MAARFDITLLGDKQLSAQLAALTGKLERNILARALRSAAFKVRNAARVNVGTSQVRIPKGTTRRQAKRLQRAFTRNRSRLRNNLYVRPLKRRTHRVGSAVYTGTRQQLGITSKYYFPAHVEAGHGEPHRTSRRLERLTRKAELGGRRTPPHPFLRPALLSNRQAIFTLVGEEIRRRLPQEAKTP
jgi:hypothetical protein